MLKRPGLIVTIGVLVLCLVAGYARADDSDNRALLNRVIELESQVHDLAQKTNAQSYAPGANPAGDGVVVSNNISPPDMETRMESLETQIRNLTGQVEQSTYQTQQVNAGLQKLSSDIDFRLQQMEQHQAMIPPNGAPVGIAAADPNAPITNMIAPVPGAMIATAPPVSPGPDAQSTPEDLYNRAYSEMQRKEYGTAQQDFKSFLATNPNSKLAPNAQYWLGEIYYAQGNYKMASATFADGYQKEPKGAKAPDNLLKLGLSLEQQNRTKDACTVLRQLVKDYPAAPDTVTSSATRGIKRMQCSGGSA